MSFTPRFLRHRGITIIQKLDPSVPRLHSGKVGMVLAGGAVAGGAFKAGGLRALDEALVRRTVPGGTSYPFGLNEFDVFVGLSAGSMLACVLASGIGTEELSRIVRGTSDTYAAFRAWHFMRPNVGELIERLALCADKEQELFTGWLSGNTDPRTAARYTLGKTLGKMAQALGRLIPTGLFDPRPLGEYFRLNIEKSGFADNFERAFEQTGKELYLTATDLNRGEMVVFGHDEPYRDVPISTAIAASCALPLWYRPLRIPNPLAGPPGAPASLDLVDGALMRTANVRVAVEKGCDLVICYNPFTRIRYDRRGRYLYEHGALAVGSQAIRTLVGARLDLAKELVYRDDTVQADIVFIEPAEDDYAFFAMNALNFWEKDRAASHGYNAVRASIEASHELLAQLFAHHGIELRTPPRAHAGRLPTDEQMQVDLRESRGRAR